MDGLFNFQDPRMLQEQYLAQQRQNAMAASQLPLLQQVVASGGNLGANLGTSLGRMFGGRTAAEVENETMRGIFAGAAQQSADPVERLQIAAAEFRKRGMEDRAIALEQEAAKMGAQVATARQAEAAMMQEQQGYQMRYEGLKARYPEMTDEEARSLANDPAAFREVMKVPKADTQVVETAEGQILIDKRTGQRIAKIGPSPDRRAVTQVNIDSRDATQSLSLVRDFEATVKPSRASLNDARTAQQLITEAAATNNSQAWEQARTLLAKATGKGRLSNEDIRRTGIDPRLVQGISDWVNKKVEGVPGRDIQAQLFTVAKMLERQAAEEIEMVARRAREVGRLADLPEDKLDVYFPGVGDSSNVVNWNDLP